MAFFIHQRLTSLKSLHEFRFVIFCFLPQYIWYSIIAIVVSFNNIWFLSLRRFHLNEIKIWVFNWSGNNLVILILRKLFDVDFLYFLYYVLFPTFSVLDGRIKFFLRIIIFRICHCFLFVLPALINLFYWLLRFRLIGTQVLLSHFLSQVFIFNLKN